MKKELNTTAMYFIAIGINLAPVIISHLATYNQTGDGKMIVLIYGAFFLASCLLYLTLFALEWMEGRNKILNILTIFSYPIVFFILSVIFEISDFEKNNILESILRYLILFGILLAMNVVMGVYMLKRFIKKSHSVAFKIKETAHN